MKKINLILVLSVHFLFCYGQNRTDTYYQKGLPIYNKHASIVIGQKDFNSKSTNQGGALGPNTLRNPGQVLLIGEKLLICDAQNNRIVVFNKIPLRNNESADYVIGQMDLVTTVVPACDPIFTDRPSGLAHDGKRLFVLDRDHYRVLIYNKVPDSSGASANFVIGQRDLYTEIFGGEEGTGDTARMSSSRFSSGATGMVYDSLTGKLLVYDSDNNRVMIFDSVPYSKNEISASILIGQPRWTTNLANQGAGPAANTLDLSTANGVATYKGKIIIADRLNNRILIFNKFPTKNNENADVVIGQDNFNSNLANKGGPISAYGLNNPRSVTVDKYGRLFVTEALSARILVYDSIPTQNGMPANHVIGQPDFSKGDPSTTDSTFGTFISHVLTTDDYLIVSESGNERVLIFTNININLNLEDGLSKKDIKIYPNPAHNKIKIDGFKNNEIEFEVIQLDGKIIDFGSVDKNNFELNFNYNAGLYFLRLFDKNGKLNFIEKIVIE